MRTHPFRIVKTVNRVTTNVTLECGHKVSTTNDRKAGSYIICLACPPTRQMRFSTAIRKYGPIQHAEKIPESEWNKAVAEKRFATIYHGDSDYLTPLTAEVCHHGW